MIDESYEHRLRSPNNQRLALSVSEDLRILSGDNMMVNLPPKWQRFALLTGTPVDSPVVVVQLKLNNDEWAYLATHNGESLSDLVHRRKVGNKFFNLSNDIDPYDTLSSIGGASTTPVVTSR